MKKKTKIKLASIVCIIIICGTWIYLDTYGNPFIKAQMKGKLYTYLEEELPDIQQDFTCGEVGFNMKWKTYFMTCKSNTQPELTFAVEELVDGSIQDSYQFNAIEGNNAFAKFEQQLTSTVIEKISDYKTLYVRVHTTLDKLEESSRIAFIKNEDVLSLPIYSVAFHEGRSKQYEEPSYVAQRFMAIRKAVEATGFIPHSYALTFFDETGNIGYEMIGVTAQLMDREDFENILQELVQEPLKYETSLGIQRINIEPK